MPKVDNELKYYQLRNNNSLYVAHKTTDSNNRCLLTAEKINFLSKFLIDETRDDLWYLLAT